MVQNEREIQKWRVQKREQEMQAKIEATHTVEASLDECDAFPFYAPVQPDLSDETGNFGFVGLIVTIFLLTISV